MNLHNVTEYISCVDGSVKIFNWESDDTEMMKWYFESRGLNEVLSVEVDGEPITLERADEMVCEWERQYTERH